MLLDYLLQMQFEGDSDRRRDIFQLQIFGSPLVFFLIKAQTVQLIFDSD